jgi:hypothetical protein
MNKERLKERIIISLEKTLQKDLSSQEITEIKKHLDYAFMAGYEYAHTLLLDYSTNNRIPIARYYNGKLKQTHPSILDAAEMIGGYSEFIIKAMRKGKKYKGYTFERV